MTERTYRTFVGFYWTLPLPSMGFKDLPDAVDEAARKSRTIRYQRDRVRAYVQECKGILVEELVFLEERFDRVSGTVESYIERALKACKKHDAQLLFVDFSLAGYRDHPFMNREMRRSEISCLDLPPDPMVMDGVEFDPVAHFRAVKATRDGWASPAERREALAGRVADVVAELRTDGTPTYQEIASLLNLQGITTITGKAWTAVNLKQFLKSISAAS